MTPEEDFLYALHSHPYFDIWKKSVLKHRPMVRSYHPQSYSDADKWKYDSARRDGFDMVLTLLKIEPEEK
jgi:hypothetical protein